MKPRKHAELIKAWADGAQIQQYRPEVDEWRDCCPYPVWDERLTYRIKPEPKPNFYRHYKISDEGVIYPRGFCIDMDANLRIYFNGETGKPKSAEVLK